MYIQVCFDQIRLKPATGNMSPSTTCCMDGWSASKSAPQTDFLLMRIVAYKPAVQKARLVKEGMRFL